MIEEAVHFGLRDRIWGQLDIVLHQEMAQEDLDLHGGEETPWTSILSMSKTQGRRGSRYKLHVLCDALLSHEKKSIAIEDVGIREVLFVPGVVHGNHKL